MNKLNAVMRAAGVYVCVVINDHTFKIDAKIKSVKCILSKQTHSLAHAK